MTREPETPGFYFFHIPKTAGTTVGKAIESAYPTDLICPYWLWDQLIDVPRPELARYRVFRGHFYGFLEEYLQRQLRKLTILRDPVERTISYYYYVRRLQEHPNHQHAKTMSLHEFCTDERTRYLIENYQAGYLATFVLTRDPAQLVTKFTPEQKRNHLFQAALEPRCQDIREDVLLEAAQSGLSRFDVVGIVEDLEGAIKRANAVLGCSMSLPDRRQNITPDRIPAGEIDDLTMSTIREVTRVDQSLYDRVSAQLKDTPASDKNLRPGAP